MPLCDPCKCRDVGHIQLWIANRLREDDSRLIRDLGFEICQIIRICKNCCNPKRFQIVVKINRSSIQAGACDDLITTSYDIQKALVIAAMPDAQATDATPFSRTVMRSSNAAMVGLLILV